MALLVGTALLVVVFGLGPYAAMGMGMGLVFLWAVGRGNRSKLRDPAFIAFFIVWLAVHVVLFLVVLKQLGLAYHVPFALLDLWAGYYVAMLHFGPPVRSK